MSESITARYVSTLNLLLAARIVSGAGGPYKNVIGKLHSEARRQLYCESLAIAWAFNSYSKNRSHSDSVNSFNDWIRETTTPRFTSCFWTVLRTPLKRFSTSFQNKVSITVSSFADFFGVYFPSRCCYLSTLKMCTGGSLYFGFLRQPLVAFG